MRHGRLVMMWLALSGTGLAQEQGDAKSEAATFAYLAELAPTVCHELKTDRKAVSALLAHAGLTEQDLTGRYGKATQAAAESFRFAARLRTGPVCSDIWDRLGEGGLGLLTTADDD